MRWQAGMYVFRFAGSRGDGLRKPLYDAEKHAAPATVCVTGGTGYIAGAIIRRLLAMGMTVHTTVRDPDNQGKLAHLQRFPGAGSRLKYFKVGHPSSYYGTQRIPPVLACHQRTKQL